MSHQGIQVKTWQLFYSMGAKCFVFLGSVEAHNLQQLKGALVTGPANVVACTRAIMNLKPQTHVNYHPTLAWEEVST